MATGGPWGVGRLNQKESRRFREAMELEEDTGQRQ